MKTSRLALLSSVIALAVVPSLQAQSRFNVQEFIRNIMTRTPLNAASTVTRTTPQGGTVTVATTNTFNGTSGSFDTDITLPNNSTTSVTGTISITQGSGVSVSGSVTGPGGQSTSFINVATPSAGGVTISSTVTPPNGNTLTRTNTLTPPADANNDADNMLIALLKRLRTPLLPRG
ncbi:MAG: hypothetical protein PSW75_12765 [bacterium]|nr:hypothetical protein [bacterium]MDI1336643.1 hypothetical protein [Lacunisphaera sp.]